MLVKVFGSQWFDINGIYLQDFKIKVGDSSFYDTGFVLKESKYEKNYSDEVYYFLHHREQFERDNSKYDERYHDTLGREIDWDFIEPFSWHYAEGTQIVLGHRTFQKSVYDKGRQCNIDKIITQDVSINIWFRTQDEVALKINEQINRKGGWTLDIAANNGLSAALDKLYRTQYCRRDRYTDGNSVL